jgi:hypothetical protein
MQRINDMTVPSNGDKQHFCARVGYYKFAFQHSSKLMTNYYNIQL